VACKLVLFAEGDAMLSLIAAAALAASAPPSAPVTLGQLKTATAVALAPQVLPAQTAANITGGVVRRAFLPTVVYYVGFFERPVPYAEGLCRRAAHWTHLRAPQTTGPVSDDALMEAEPVRNSVHYAATWPGPATDAACQAAKGWIVADEPFTQAKVERLRRLTWAMNEAAGRGKLDFAVTCASQTPEACANPRKALADLPLESLLSISLRDPASQTEPPGPAAQARFNERVAAGRWPEAELSFDMSAPDGRSWIVTMKGADRVEAMELQRLTVIRH
jgi:hypothetical protein